jgi:NAD(P)-dependent dehydrogenase (short-subunit alcohol dehydrogenase family)
VVNNAGRQQYCESLEDLTTADFDATFKTNVYAPFWITRPRCAIFRPKRDHQYLFRAGL